MAGQWKLNEETTEGLRRAIATGSPIKYACMMVGVGESTYHRWNQRGEQYERHLDAAGEVDTAEQPFLEFAQTMRTARGQAVVAAVTRVREAMNGRGVRMIDGKEVSFESDPDWRAAAWYLEHAHPDDFGRKTRHELTGPDGGPIEISDSDRVSQLLDDVDSYLARAAAEAAAVDEANPVHGPPTPVMPAPAE